MKFTIDIITESKDIAIKDKCLSAVSDVLKKDGEYFDAGYTLKAYHFRELVLPLVKYLREHYHPHSKIIIEYDSAEIVEGACCESFKVND